MKNVQNLSFQELGNRELLKGWVWWTGMIATVSAAAYTYGKANQ